MPLGLEFELARGPGGYGPFPEVPVAVDHVVDSRPVVLELADQDALPARGSFVVFCDFPDLHDANRVCGVEDGRLVLERTCVERLNRAGVVCD